jgi:hypothetical protein
MKKILFFILLAGTLSQACKRKCRDVQSNQAPFRTYTSFTTYVDNKEKNIIAESDIFLVGGQVIIESLVENALKYEWKLSGDPNLKEGKKLAIYFQSPSVRAGDSLEIMSIVTRTPNPECIAGDDGVDTLIKKIHFIDYKSLPYFGRFRVHDEINEPNKYFEINISRKRTSLGDSLNAIEFLPADAIIPLSFGEGLGVFSCGVDQYWSSSDVIPPITAADKMKYTAAVNEKGIGLLTVSGDKQSIVIEHHFRIDDKDDPRYKKIIKCRFIGKRIN